MKLRLDFWKKSFWTERHLLTGVKDGFVETLFPAKVAKILLTVTDLIDDGKLNDSAKADDKAYKYARLSFSVITFAVLLYMFFTGGISPDRFFNLLNEFVLPFLSYVGTAASFAFFAVVHGEQYRVKAPIVNPETKIYGQGAAPTFYEFTITDENGNRKVCRDNFGEIVTASSYVDYPFGVDKTKRATEYIQENIERFEKVEPEPAPEPDPIPEPEPEPDPTPVNP
jgi:hypothetical protein